jgi:hypothetical protein
MRRLIRLGPRWLLASLLLAGCTNFGSGPLPTDKLHSGLDLGTGIPEAAVASAGIVTRGFSAPDISGPDVGGKSMKLSDFRGKVVMLDFSGTW